MRLSEKSPDRTVPNLDGASQDQAPPSALDIVRCIATARIIMPRSVVRLSAGRLNFSRSDQVYSNLTLMPCTMTVGLHWHHSALACCIPHSHIPG